MNKIYNKCDCYMVHENVGGKDGCGCECHKSIPLEARKRFEKRFVKSYDTSSQYHGKDKNHKYLKASIEDLMRFFEEEMALAEQAYKSQAFSDGVSDATDKHCQYLLQFIKEREEVLTPEEIIADLKDLFINNQIKLRKDFVW